MRKQAFVLLIVILGGVSVYVASSAGQPLARQAGGPVDTLPPLPVVGYPPPRPIQIVRSVYRFAAEHPEVLRYVPCYCGCGAEGHKANESCFVKSRDAKGQVTWDEHGMGCAVCVDVARTAMQMHASGASVADIRRAIEATYDATYKAGKTPTPPVPAVPPKPAPKK